MTIALVDCDDNRRPLLAKLVTQAFGGVTPLITDTMPSMLEPGTLLICHVGDRQHERERRLLGDKLKNAVTASQCVVAGFTGGTISHHFERQMPHQGNAFVINDRASSPKVSEPFGADIQRLVDAWISQAGKLRGESLAQVWIGYDPALEAILDTLIALLRGTVPVDGVDDVTELLEKFGIVDLDQNLRTILSSTDETKRLFHITELRDRLLRGRARIGSIE